MYCEFVQHQVDPSRQLHGRVVVRAERVVPRPDTVGAWSGMYAIDDDPSDTRYPNVRPPLWGDLQCQHVVSLDAVLTWL